MNKLRKGDFDVLVGVNLLREGLDIPEVSTVIIFDADKEGFLRNRTTLLQTIGRAARHINGKAILYADRTTNSMKQAIQETDRRRKKQEQYNKKHNITPKSVHKKIYETPQELIEMEQERKHKDTIENASMKELNRQMKQAAKDLDFERAAQIRDEIRQVETLENKKSD